MGLSARNHGLGSCCDPAEYFLRIMVIASMVQWRKENRNHRGCQYVFSMGVVYAWRSGGRGQRGYRWGADVIGAISRVSRAYRPRNAPNGERRRD
jgi:hypothetical protein